MSKKPSIVNMLGLGVKGLLVTMIGVISLSASSFGGEVVIKQMIAGKEYRVEKAEKPKTYWVYYGDEKLLWEPKPWQVKDLKEQGPGFYDRWTQKGLPRPLDTSMEEREKLTGNQVYRAWMDVEETGPMLDYKGGSGMYIIDKAGGERFRIFSQWKRAYYRRPEIYKNEGVINKRFFSMIYPDDIRGLGMLVKVYDDPKRDQDTWLYLPSVRRIRRMSTGAKEDFAFGTPARNEDFPIMDPYLHNYKVVGIELFKDPGPQVFGFGNSEYEIPNIKKHVHARIDGIGAPCFVVECTRGPKKWWFEKKIQYIGIKDFSMYLEKAYDQSGNLRRIAELPFRPGNECYPEANPNYLLWASWPMHDLHTGYKFVCVGSARQDKSVLEEVFFDSDYSENIYTPEMLTREFTSTTLW